MLIVNDEFRHRLEKVRQGLIRVRITVDCHGRTYLCGGWSCNEIDDPVYHFIESTTNYLDSNFYSGARFENEEWGDLRHLSPKLPDFIERRYFNGLYIETTWED